MHIHSISLTGRRPTNEDQHDIILNINELNKSLNPINFFGVYDGHGGKFVSKYLKKNLSNYFLRKDVNIQNGGSKDKNKINKYKKYIERVFDHIQNKLSIEYKNVTKHIGSTALIMMQTYNLSKTKTFIYIGNVGDCRAILCNGVNLAKQLTKDHKPYKLEERKRIEALGGNIIFDGDWRIKDLSLSRAFGDLDARPYVTHKPDIFRYEICKSYKFIVLGCDGLWDVLSNQEVVDFICEHCMNVKTGKMMFNKQNIAHKLAEYAIKRGSFDNVSIIIIFL